MKVSPPCTKDEGREVFFTARVDAQKYRLTVPRALLDDTCGEAANETARKAWVKAQMPDIKAWLTAKINGAAVSAPYQRILVEEIS